MGSASLHGFLRFYCHAILEAVRVAKLCCVHDMQSLLGIWSRTDVNRHLVEAQVVPLLFRFPRLEQPIEQQLERQEGHADRFPSSEIVRVRPTPCEMAVERLWAQTLANGK